MKPLVATESWEIISKRVYWDRDVPLDRWREKIKEGHRSYLPDAVSTMTPREFLAFYGVDDFVLDWPSIRSKLPPESMKHTPMLDCFWSQLRGGGFHLHPSKDFYLIPEKRREFLIEVSRRPGISIYEAAKNLSMQYRRAHDIAMRLVSEGRVKAVSAVRNGRRVAALFSRFGGPKAS